MDLPSQTMMDQIKETIRHEIGKLLEKSQERRSHEHNNFRAVNGLPICFYCKRLGHVKKYCRIWNNNRFQTSEREFHEKKLPKSAENKTFAVDCIQNDVLESTEETSEDFMEGNIGYNYDLVADVGNRFKQLQMIADELNIMISRACNKDRSSKEITDLEASLFKGAMLEAIQTFDRINRTLDMPKDPAQRNPSSDVIETPFGGDLPGHDDYMIVPFHQETIHRLHCSEVT